MLGGACDGRCRDRYRDSRELMKNVRNARDETVKNYKSKATSQNQVVG